MISPRNRLKSSKEIEYVFSHGFSAQSGFLFLKCLKTNNPETRFAITIGKNFSKLATRRNRIKRIVREEIRKILSNCKTGYDIVIFFRIPKEKNNELEERIEKDLKNALLRAKILIS